MVRDPQVLEIQHGRQCRRGGQREGSGCVDMDRQPDAEPRPESPHAGREKDPHGFELAEFAAGYMVHDIQVERDLDRRDGQPARWSAFP